MVKAKITKNMISFVPVRRGEWTFKISVYRTKQVMIIAQHCFDIGNIHIKCFSSQNDAADFIEQLANEDYSE